MRTFNAFPCGCDGNQFGAGETPIIKLTAAGGRIHRCKIVVQFHCNKPTITQLKSLRLVNGRGGSGKDIYDRYKVFWLCRSAVIVATAVSGASIPGPCCGSCLELLSSSEFWKIMNLLYVFQGKVLICNFQIHKFYQTNAAKVKKRRIYNLA